MSDPLRIAATAPVSHLLTDAEIDAAEARANAATPGPWEATCERMVETAWTDSDDERLDVCEVLHYGAKGHAGGTAAFIAHARTDAPALARTARAERRRAEEAERERGEFAEALASQHIIGEGFQAALSMAERERGEHVAAIEHITRERDAAKAVADAWAERHATWKVWERAAHLASLFFGARHERQAAQRAHDAACAKLEALGVSL